ncbi:YkyA family protein [Bacillus sp. FSL K6-3431]|uniref:YkyA family protein n=1 Tax=Bacillus sp. FSL K6-3431 TaxID=2921500 RepID=UPI0030F56D63
MKKIIITTCMLIMAVIMSACSAPEENIYQTLEDTVGKESNFEQQQKPLTELEIAEKALFDEIMELGMKDFEKISQKADEGLANLDKREALLKKEKESIDASKETFSKISEEVSNLEEDNIKKEAENLQNVMKKRYESYDNLYSSYIEGIGEDRKTYEMIKDKELRMEDLQTQIETTNKVYENVFEANSQFNEQTEKFNKAKAKFYKEAGIKVEKAG